MKRNSFIMSALCSVLAAGLFTSCKDDGPEAPKYADVPFETISLRADGETASGEVADKNITFRFKTAENFSSAQLILTVNEGWTLVFPTDPNNYDVSTDPNIYFTDPNNARVQYYVTITSDALPIIDGSKVSVEGGYKVSYNIATKSFTVVYDPAMDRANVKFVFGAGSLMDGSTVENPVLDLSAGPGTLKITLGTTVTEYPVSIDYSAVLVDPKSWGFTDETPSDLKTKYPSLTVLKASALSKQVPAPNSGAETQAWWDNTGYEDQIAKMGILGDYADDREKVEISACDFNIVTFNEADFKGRIIADATSVSSGMSVETVTSGIAMTGCPAPWTCWVKSEGTIYSKTSASWWTGVKAKGTSHGLCFGFDANGKMGLKRITPDPSADIFHVLGDFRKASDFGYDYGTRLDDNSYAPFRDDFTVAGEDWAVTGAVYFNPALVVDGYKVHFADAMANDGDTEVLGQGFNGQRSRCYIGRTIDNKIGLAAICDRNMNIMQGAYVLADLGWTDVYYVGGDNYQLDTFKPTIYIDGKQICGAEGQAAKYVVAFDAK